MNAKTLLPSKAFAGGPLLWSHSSLTCGGIERQIIHTAKELSREKVEIDLLCDSLSPSEGKDFFLTDCLPYFQSIKTIDQLPEDIIEELMPLLVKIPFSICWLPEGKQNAFLRYTLWMLHVRPRLVHVWHGDFPLRALAACVAGVPKVLLSGRAMSTRWRQPYGMEGPDPEETYAIYKLALQYPALVLTNNSSAGKTDYAHWLGLNESAIYLTHNIAQTPDASLDDAIEFRKKYDIADNTKLIGGAFRFTPMKDPVLWIKTIAEVVERREGVMGVLWGDGPLYDTCRLMVIQKGLQDKILLPGKDKDWTKTMLAYDVFLLSSQVEGLPNVVLEAQALGVPVVSTNAGGVADIIMDGHTGWVLRSRKPEIISEKLLFVLDNEEWRNKAAKLASKHIARNFSAQNHMKVLKEIYGDSLYLR
jgi:Glycosyltransferase